MGEAGGDDIQGAISDIARLQEKYERLESLRNSSKEGSDSQEKEDKGQSPEEGMELVEDEKLSAEHHKNEKTAQKGVAVPENAPSKEISVFRDLLMKTMMEHQGLNLHHKKMMMTQM